jgi:hypothetical protein
MLLSLSGITEENHKKLWSLQPAAFENKLWMLKMNAKN